MYRGIEANQKWHGKKLWLALASFEDRIGDIYIQFLKAAATQ